MYVVVLIVPHVRGRPNMRAVVFSAFAPNAAFSFAIRTCDLLRIRARAHTQTHVILYVQHVCVCVYGITQYLRS